MKSTQEQHTQSAGETPVQYASQEWIDTVLNPAYQAEIKKKATLAIHAYTPDVAIRHFLDKSTAASEALIESGWFEQFAAKHNKRAVRSLNKDGQVQYCFEDSTNNGEF